MEKIRLGRTELMVSASSFGALPIQRISEAESTKLLRMAYEGGMNYFDTANSYTDSEEKIGKALSHVRHDIIISTKTGATDKKTALAHIENSLRMLKTDYIDLIQLHNPAQLPDVDDPDSTYGALKEAQKKGYVRFIGITNHHADRAREAVLSGAYDTLQFPFSSLAAERDIELAKLTHEKDMGFIAMKGLSGGLITNAATTFSFIKQYPFVVPIWGIQKESELKEFLELEKNPPVYEEMLPIIEQDRKELCGDFCRGCGYCLPCPVGIDIPTVARMSLMLRRMPVAGQMRPAKRERVANIANCIGCRKCAERCPYHLDTPALLKESLADYQAFAAEYDKKMAEESKGNC
ncbi:MAG: aldo/keto reductase [Christensenellaceae bacterium]|nr:aldo/keto reductase [Christensenellaceae bacterium]